VGTVPNRLQKNGFSCCFQPFDKLLGFRRLKWPELSPQKFQDLLHFWISDGFIQRNYQRKHSSNPISPDLWEILLFTGSEMPIFQNVPFA